MLLEQVHLRALPGRESEFEVALCEVRQRIFLSAGFRGLDVVQDAEDPTRYLVQVRWESAEELAEFTDSRFERAWEPARAFLAEPPRVEHYLQRPGLGLTGPGVLTDLSWVSG